MASRVVDPVAGREPFALPELTSAGRTAWPFVCAALVVVAALAGVLLGRQLRPPPRANSAHHSAAADVAGVDAVIAALDYTRNSDRAVLAAAGSSSDQAAAARSLARAYTTAAAALGAVRPPVAGQARIVRQLVVTGRAYGRLANAAKAGRAVRFGRAEADVAREEARLVAGLAK
jgi:hypothetical protein